jgi:HD-GYP domain-containing protein (c-di-GMP phosphodiesterase class II)
VVEKTVQLALAMGMHESELVHVRRGALLHDIGKMGVPDVILHKRGPLTEEEWEVMRRHPTDAFELLSRIPYLKTALDIPYRHHERWDGSGYPDGLQGEEIPLAARIFAVVDVWDALLSERPYRHAWPEAEVIAYLRDNAGRQFDPTVVEMFLRLLDQK